MARSAWGILPVFLLSVSLGVLIRALKLDGAIRRAFDARVGTAIVLATAVGAFSPFCSCTVIPVVAGLLIGGVPLAPVMAFWVASPTMDPEIIALSVGFLGWDLAVARLAATLVLSLTAGYLTLALTRGGLLDKVLRREKTPAESEGPGGCRSSAVASTPAAPVRVPVEMCASRSTTVDAAPAERPERSCGTGCGADEGADPARERWYSSAF